MRLLCFKYFCLSKLYPDFLPRFLTKPIFLILKDCKIIFETFFAKYEYVNVL